MFHIAECSRRTVKFISPLSGGVYPSTGAEKTRGIDCGEGHGKRDDPHHYPDPFSER